MGRLRDFFAILSAGIFKKPSPSLCVKKLKPFFFNFFLLFFLSWDLVAVILRRKIKVFGCVGCLFFI